MPSIPTLKRQQLLPTTTGVPAPPVVLAQDTVGQSMKHLGATFGSIADDLFAQQAQDHVTQATANAMVKLNSLKIEMDQQDGFNVLGDTTDKMNEIYNSAVQGMAPIATDAFNAKWGALASKTMIAIEGAAIARGRLKMEGNLETALTLFASGMKNENEAIGFDTALKSGEEAIDNAERNRIISPLDAVKRKKKFREDVAENAILGWISRQTQKVGDFQQIFAAMNQMTTGKIDDEVIKEFWDSPHVNQAKKKTFIAALNTKMKNMASWFDKVENEETENRKKTTFNLIRKIYDPETTPEDRGQALKAIGVLGTISPQTYIKMQGDVTVISGRLMDQEVRGALLTSIYQNQGTLNEIINAEGITWEEKSKMISALDSRSQKDLARAKEIISSNPVFLPANKIDKTLKGDELTRAAAVVYADLQEKYDKARKENKPFDAVTEARKLIKEYQENIPSLEAIKTEAKEGLDALGLKSKEAVNSYIARSKNMAQTERTKILGWSRKVFDQ